jgi:NADPH-dependent 2,4-dienoyl-CoA reductase/sulfur reductase-like enzyme
MAAAVGPEMGRACASLHGDNGVPLLTGTGVAGLVAVDGRVRAVRLDDGRTLPADLVVVAIGIVPAAEWLAGSGLTVDNGVVTDAGWCTAVPGVMAVGDVARHDCVAGPARHEHWTNAAEQSRVAALNLLAGKHTGHCTGPGYFWSDQYGVRIQFAGSIDPADEVRVVEGSVADRKFLATYHRDGRTTGALAMNSARAFVRARRTFATMTEEGDRCRTCSSTALGGTR